MNMVSLASGIEGYPLAVSAAFMLQLDLSLDLQCARDVSPQWCTFCQCPGGTMFCVLAAQRRLPLCS